MGADSTPERACPESLGSMSSNMPRRILSTDDGSYSAPEHACPGPILDLYPEAARHLPARMPLHLDVVPSRR